MTTTPTDLAREGQDAATNAADMRVVALVDAEIARLNATGREWSANTARAAMPTCSPGLIGSRVKAALMRGDMAPVWEGCAGCGTRRLKEVPSTLLSTRGKRIVVYRGVAS